MDILILAQSTGNSGISSVDNLVAMFIQIIGAIIGLGFILDAGKGSFGKGGSNEKGKNVSMSILWFVIVVVIFAAIPKLLGIGGGFLDYL